MFSLDQQLSAQVLREKQLVKAFYSINVHQVATPEMKLEDARSYVFFAQERPGLLMACVGLYLLESSRRQFYAYASNPFPDKELNAVAEEAMIFVEGLGAMLDSVDFIQLSSDEKRRWIEEQEIFALDGTRTLNKAFPGRHAAQSTAFAISQAMMPKRSPAIIHEHLTERGSVHTDREALIRLLASF